MKELLTIVRAVGEDRHVCPGALPASERIDEVLARMERAAEAELGGLTVRELVAAPATTTAGDDTQPVIKRFGG